MARISRTEREGRVQPTAEYHKRQGIASLIGSWVDACQRRAAVVVSIALLISIAAGVYLAENLRIDTNTEDMLSAELSFRKNAIALDAAFPVLDDNLLVVLEAPNADAADDGVRRLADAMRNRSDVFQSVFSAEDNPYLRKNGLLYLETAELEDLSSRLASAQPFLGTLWQQPNLEGLSDMLELMAGEGADAKTSGQAGNVIGEMADVAERIRGGHEANLIWSEVILGSKSETPPVRRLIQTKPKLDYGSLYPAAHAADTLQDIAAAEGLNENGYKLRLTGSAALESDELKSVEVGMGTAGVISLTIVVVVLLAGLRSIGVMAALFVTLLIGLLWTGAFAILALGSLNLISVAFAVLFVGLSVDFGIHYVLRAAEYAARAESWAAALWHGGRSVGSSLVICALTTSIAFFSFLPTTYVGLAELGLIAGVGMFVALICNLTVLPALLRLLVRKPPVFEVMHGPVGSGRKMSRYAPFIVGIGVISAMFSGWLATGARFDFDPMNLKNPAAPSMVTLFDLMDDGIVHPYSAEILADNLDTAEKLSDTLAQLDTVKRVDGIFSLIPENQQDKLAIIDRMALFLGPAFFAPPGDIAMPPQKLNESRNSILQSLDHLMSDKELAAPASRLMMAFKGTSPDQLAKINEGLFRFLPGRLNDLITAMEADGIRLETLPDTLKNRYLAADGTVRLEVLPKADLRDPEALRTFVSDVQAVAPHVTGGPVIIVEAGQAVLDAFGKALAISLIGIGAVLWLVLRRIGDVLLVFAPVCVAALWTLAASSVVDIPFNFANVIVLPLLFGLSVDFGVHIVLRQRNADAAMDHDAMSTTTPRAILLSALTTVGSFGSIMLSGHPGTASMGVLLTLSIILSLIAILVFLPALMTLLKPSRRAG